MEFEMICVPGAVDIKQEPLEVKQDCQLKSEVKSEDDDPLSSATAMTDEYDKIENTDFVLKFEEGSTNIAHEENKEEDEVVVGTSGLLRSTNNTGDTSLAIPILQQEHISQLEVSETDEDTSQHADVDLCSYSPDFCNIKLNKHFHLQKRNVNHINKFSNKFGTEFESQNVQVQKNNRSELIHHHICSICNKSFTQREDFMKHVRTHTGERSYSCEICNRSFARREYLKRHMKIHTGKRPFSCEICNKSFKVRGSFKRHMRTHTGEQTFCCEICSKTFTLNQGLKIHMRSHTGEQLFCCEICNKSFTQSEDLKRHIRIHTGERPFCCKICDKSFSLLQNLKMHVKIHTGERPFSCEICNKSFTQRAHLRRHIGIHTGERVMSTPYGLY